MNERIPWDELGLAYASSTTRRDGSCLLAEERPAVERACSKRVADFATGRWCAREAFRLLGLAPAPIPMEASRAPRWPSGFVGSITHTEGYAAAVVAPSSRLAGVGVDAQVVEPGRINEGMAELILLPGEEEGLRDLPRDEARTLAFTAKEALYKCLNPIVGRFFGFHAARVEGVDLGRGLLRLVLVDDLGPRFPAGSLYEGRVARHDGVLESVIVLPPAAGG